MRPETIEAHLHFIREAEKLKNVLRSAPGQADVLALWGEFKSAATPEARAVKALDKVETILQHNQGKKYTDALPLFQTIRAALDADTRQRMPGGKTTSGQAGQMLSDALSGLHR